MFEEKKSRILMHVGGGIQIMIVIACLIFISVTAGAAANVKDADLGGMQIVEISTYDAEGNLVDRSTEDERTSSVPQTPTVKNAMLLSTEIETDITGFIVKTRVKQRFKNQTSNWIEGLYRFPLPDKAAVDSMTLIVGDRRIVGKVKEKEEAKRVYKAAVKAGKKAALLTEHRPNIFSTKVGNVAPGSIIEVELTLISYAEQNGLSFTWSMPQVITPRYSDTLIIDGDGVSATPIGAANYALDRRGAGKANPTSFSVRLKSGTALKSLLSESHDLAVTNLGVGDYQIGLKGGVIPADRDFKLTWELTPGATAKPILFRETDATIFEGGEFMEDGADYVLGFVLPPEAGALDYIAPRDVTFIIDTSGSMGGESIEQAKTALLHALDLLRPEDKFDIIEFNSGFTRLFGESQAANALALTEGRAFVQGLRADGGTRMLPALESALNDAHDPEVQRQILFLTDGAIGYEDAMFKLVTNKLGNARLFTVGIGSAPNGWFMRKAAEFGRGAHIEISNIDTAGEKLSQLYSAMAAPSARGLALSGASESFPEKLPDLFGNRPTVFVARVDEGANMITLSGRDARGRSWSENLDLSSLPTGSGISKMWARKKVEGLIHERVRGADQAAIRAGVLDVALTHQILSPFTSFVAVEEKISRPQNAALKKTNVKGNLPKGTEPKKFFGPKTAIPLKLKLVLGMVALLLAFFGALRLWRPAPPRPRFQMGRLP
jgi:Ca-activated chloride channel family protein